MSSERVNTVGLMGHGTLYEAVRQRLSADAYHVLSLNVDEPGTETARCPVIVSVSDGWDPRLNVEVSGYSTERRTPWLRVCAELGKAIIGPCVFPGKSGCVTCAETRRMNARQDAKEYAETLARHTDDLAFPQWSWMTTFGQHVLADLIVEEVANVIDGRGEIRTRNAMVFLELKGLRSSVHRFLPDPLCPECGNLPEDTEEAAYLALKSRPKVSSTSYRVRLLTTEKNRMMESYVDAEAGMVRKVNKDGRSIFPTASAPVGLRGSHATDAGFGRQLNYESSQLTAVTEALERYGGVRPGGKRTVVRASYNQLGERALDPTTLGLPSNEQYELPDYPYRRYKPDLTFNWVWGYSFKHQRPVLVPEDYAYYGTLYRSRQDHPFVYEISNGCALGGCLEEAILYGILEVAERDAFLMTWYARLEAPRIDLDSVRDRSVALIVERIEYATGYTIHAFNTTLEQGIPCCWTMAVDEQDRFGWPKALCTAGAHLDHEKALANALLELAPMVRDQKPYYAGNRERALKMFNDPYAVLRMEDHSLLYSAPEAFERLGFLCTSTQQQSLDESFKDSYARPRHSDLLQDLNNAVVGYLDAGLDVIVVDQTTPEHNVEDLSCVKVIIPGTLPMTFGHYHRRVNGLDRLYRVPYELGYYRRPLTDADINPHPHPFP